MTNAAAHAKLWTRSTELGFRATGCVVRENSSDDEVMTTRAAERSTSSHQRGNDGATRDSFMDDQVRSRASDRTDPRQRTNLCRAETRHGRLSSGYGSGMASIACDGRARL